VSEETQRIRETRGLIVGSIIWVVLSFMSYVSELSFNTYSHYLFSCHVSHTFELAYVLTCLAVSLLYYVTSEPLGASPYSLLSSSAESAAMLIMKLTEAVSKSPCISDHYITEQAVEEVQIHTIAP
jgi:hypothetical protein